MLNYINEIKEQYQGRNFAYWYGSFSIGGRYPDGKVLGFATMLAVEGIPYLMIRNSDIMGNTSNYKLPYSEITNVGMNDEKSLLKIAYYIEVQHKGLFYVISNKEREYDGDLHLLYELIELGIEGAFSTPEPQISTQPSKQEIAKAIAETREEQTNAYIREGNELQNKGLYEEALLSYKDALKTDRINPYLYFEIAGCYAKLKQVKEASIYFDKGFKLSSDLNSSDIRSLRKHAAALLFEADGFEEANTIYNDILQKPYDQTEFADGLKYLLAIGKIEEVVQKLIDNIEKYPTVFNWLVNQNGIPVSFTHELKNNEIKLVNKIKNDNQDFIPKIDKRIERFENRLNESKESNSDLKSWYQVKKEFSNADNLNDVLLAKSKTPLIGKNILSQVSKLKITDFLKDRDIDLAFYDKKVKELSFLSKQIENHDKEFSNELNDVLAKYNGLKNNIKDSQFELVKRDYMYIYGLQRAIEKGKKKVLEILDNLINQEKYDSALAYANGLLLFSKYYDDEQIKSKIEEIKILKRKSDKKKKLFVYSLVGIVFFIIAITILYSSVVKPIMEENKAWANAQEEEYYSQYIREYPKGKYIEKAKKLYEDKVWKDAQANEDFDIYLNEFSDGKYTEMAVQKKKEQKKMIEEEQRKKETNSWKEAQKQNTMESYDKYLTEYPKEIGIYADKALEKLENMIMQAKLTEEGIGLFNPYEENHITYTRLKQLFPGMDIEEGTTPSDGPDYKYYSISKDNEQFMYLAMDYDNYNKLMTMTIYNNQILDEYGIGIGTTYAEIKRNRSNLRVSDFHGIYVFIDGSNIYYSLTEELVNGGTSSLAENEIWNWKVKNIVWEFRKDKN